MSVPTGGGARAGQTRGAMVLKTPVALGAQGFENPHVSGGHGFEKLGETGCLGSENRQPADGGDGLSADLVRLACPTRRRPQRVLRCAGGSDRGASGAGQLRFAWHDLRMAVSRRWQRLAVRADAFLEQPDHDEAPHGGVDPAGPPHASATGRDGVDPNRPGVHLPRRGPVDTSVPAAVRPSDGMLTRAALRGRAWAGSGAPAWYASSEDHHSGGRRVGLTGAVCHIRTGPAETPSMLPASGAPDDEGRRSAWPRCRHTLQPSPTSAIGARRQLARARCVTSGRRLAACQQPNHPEAPYPLSCDATLTRPSTTMSLVPAPAHSS